jgi:hypothetical protein
MGPPWRCWLFDERAYEFGGAVNGNAVEFHHVQKIVIASYDAIGFSRHRERKELVVFRVAASDDVFRDDDLFRKSSVSFDIIDALIQRNIFKHVKQLGNRIVGNQRNAVRCYVIKSLLEFRARAYRETDKNIGVDNDPHQQSFFKDLNRSL